MASQDKNRDKANTVGNPVTDRNTGTVWPIWLAIVLGSFAWFLSDQDLRRGLAEITGLKALEPVLPEVHKDAMYIWGTPTSTCTQTVMLVANEKEVEYELVVLDMAAKEHKQPEHLARNPFGIIPVVQIKEGEYLYESRAIAKYLTHRYSSKGFDLLPHGVLGHAFAEQAYNIEAFEFSPFAATVYKEGILKAKRGGVPDQVILDAAKTTLESKLDVYETILSAQPYLAGQNLTLADLFHLPYGTKIIEGGLGEGLTDQKKRPHVVKWWNGLYERKSWQAVLKEEKEWHDKKEAERKLKEEADAQVARDEAKKESE